MGVQPSNAAPFCENYSKPYFDAKQLEKGIEYEVVKILGPFFLTKCPFLKKVPFLGNVKHCPKFLDLELLIEIETFKLSSSRYKSAMRVCIW